jgi:hypothetical protein
MLPLLTTQHPVLMAQILMLALFSSLNPMTHPLKSPLPLLVKTVNIHLM